MLLGSALLPGNSGMGLGGVYKTPKKCLSTDYPGQFSLDLREKVPKCFQIKHILTLQKYDG